MLFKITYDDIKSYVPDVEFIKTRSIISPVKEAKPSESKTFTGVNGKIYKINWDHSINDYTNCYAFAMGWEYSTNNNKCYIPGCFSGYLPEQYTDYKNCVIQDLHAVGRKVYELIEGKDIPKHLPACDERSYWVKAMISLNNDIGSFHIARKDEESGRWLHKLGFGKEPSIFMRNIELTPDYSKIYNHENFHLREGYKATELDLTNFAIMFRIPYQKITKSVIEEDDSASYFDYAPNIYKVDEFTEFYPLWAMRIEKPNLV